MRITLLVLVMAISTGFVLRQKWIPDANQESGAEASAVREKTHLAKEEGLRKTQIGTGEGSRPSRSTGTAEAVDAAHSSVLSRRALLASGQVAAKSRVEADGSRIENTNEIAAKRIPTKVSVRMDDGPLSDLKSKHAAERMALLSDQLGLTDQQVAEFGEKMKQSGEQARNFMTEAQSANSDRSPAEIRAQMAYFQSDRSATIRNQLGSAGADQYLALEKKQLQESYQAMAGDIAAAQAKFKESQIPKTDKPQPAPASAN